MLQNGGLDTTEPTEEDKSFVATIFGIKDRFMQVGC